MELHKIYLLFYFIWATLFAANLPTANSFICENSKKGDLRISYNSSKNGSWIEISNLKTRSKYEISVMNCRSLLTHCKKKFHTGSDMTREFFFNETCLSCGSKEAIFVRDFTHSSSVYLPIKKTGCITPPEVSIPTTVSSDITSVTTWLPKEIFSSIPDTTKDTSSSLSSTILLSSVIPSKRPNISSALSTKKIIILISIFSVIFILLLGTFLFIWKFYKNKQKTFTFSPNPSNQGLVISCPCSAVHRQATKELLSLINNFTDLHATSYLDLKISTENSISSLIQQVYNKAGWIIVIESTNLYFHSKEHSAKDIPSCNLLSQFSVLLLKHLMTINCPKTIYQVSFDLESKDFQLMDLFPGLNSPIYYLMKSRNGSDLSLNFDVIESLFGKLTYEQLGVSDKNVRRWTRNNWKESTEVNNLEEVLIDRLDGIWNSSGCYSVDQRYFPASKPPNSFQPRITQNFQWNSNATSPLEKSETGECYDPVEDDIDSYVGKTFGKSFSLTNNESLINQYPYFGKVRSVSSEVSSGVTSLKLEKININTDQKLNNVFKIVDEQLDELEELSVLSV